MTGTKNSEAVALVVDANPLRQRRLQRLLASLGIEVVALSATVERVAQLAERHDCDLVLVAPADDTTTGELFSALRKAHRRQPQLVSVALVERGSRAMADAALAAGAAAVVDPSTSLKEVTRLAGDALAERRDTGAPQSGPLTRRELEILRLVAEGRSNRDVAGLLWVTDQTVKFHLANTYRKLRVRNRFDASKWALAHGLVRA